MFGRRGGGEGKGGAHPTDLVFFNFKGFQNIKKERSAPLLIEVLDRLWLVLSLFNSLVKQEIIS